MRLYIVLVPLLLTLLAGCGGQEVVHAVDTSSGCERLRTSYPSAHGLLMFPDSSATSRSIPWCFPAAAGFGVIGYNVNIAVPRAGTLVLAVSDVTPPAEFAASSVEGTCWGDSTGKRIIPLGRGPQWSLPVAPGDYCISLITLEGRKQDVWFTLTATRP